MDASEELRQNTNILFYLFLNPNILMFLQIVY